MVTYTSKKIKKDYKYTPTKLMVVAHPDDETIFGGAHLITEPKTWKVIVVTNGLGGGEKNKDRFKGLDKAMAYSKTSYELWDHVDRYAPGLNPTAKKDLRELVKKGNFKVIVSHNLEGEYGHPQHKAVHDISKKIANKYNILFGTFGHGKKLPKEVINKKLKMFKAYKGVSDAFTKEVEGDDGETINWFEREQFNYQKLKTPQFKKCMKQNIIPHSIHQIWIGGKMAVYKKEWTSLNKELAKKQNWSYKLWGNKDITKKNFPLTYHYIQKAKKAAEKRENPNAQWAQISDLMRLEIIYHNGGFYLDSNMEILQPLNNLLPPPGKTMVVANQEPCDLNCKGHKGKKYIANGFFGATKGNEMLKESLQKKNLDTINFDSKFINRETGPYYFRKFLDPKKTYVIPYKKIYPFFLPIWDSEHIKKKEWNKCIKKKKEHAQKAKSKKVLEAETILGNYIVFPCNQYPNSYLMNHSVGGSWSW